MEISVVIPLFNKELYIRRAIDSVLSQINLPNEIIIVDDGSTDNSLNVVKAMTNPRVKLISQTNAGECAARNRGIDEASNPLIAFLDADDEWKPDFLLQINRLIQEFPNSGAFATSAQIVKPDQTLVYPQLPGIPPEPWIGIIPNFFSLFQAGNAFNASSVVVPKRILQEVGKFPEGVTISGDVACWVKIAINHQIAFSPTRSVIYHQEAQNRVGTQYKPLEEMPYIQLIRDALQSGILPIQIQQDAFDFIAQKQIFVAIENIMAGKPAYARQLLISCRQTKKYKVTWYWWWFWANMPAGCPNTFLRMKQTLIRRTI
jgi:glycosyltransferase involved in cell wall biosynthesis